MDAFFVRLDASMGRKGEKAAAVGDFGRQYHEVFLCVFLSFSLFSSSFYSGNFHFLLQNGNCRIGQL